MDIDYVGLFHYEVIVGLYFYTKVHLNLHVYEHSFRYMHLIEWVLNKLMCT